jgi:hypothetical protein
MTTSTIIKTEMNLMTTTAVYMTNCLIQLGFRIEAGRGLSGYMTENQTVIEAGLRTWLGEMTLLSVVFELFDPTADEAYEVFTVEINYLTDPHEEGEVVKPPLAELENVLKKLQRLPPGARFRVVARRAPGFTHVDGWSPTALKPFKGGKTEQVEVGDKDFGYGLAMGRITYTRGKWEDEGRP